MGHTGMKNVQVCAAQLKPLEFAKPSQAREVFVVQGGVFVWAKSNHIFSLVNLLTSRRVCLLYGKVNL